MEFRVCLWLKPAEFVVVCMCILGLVVPFFVLKVVVHLYFFLTVTFLAIINV